MNSFFRLLGALTAGLLIGASILAWRLSQGPLPLDFLTPYLEEALSASDGSLTVRLDRTVLTWAGWDRTLDIRAEGVRALGGDEAVVATVPELSFALSGRALLRGVIAPRSIELIRPGLRLLRSVDGSIRWGIGGEDGANSDEMVRRLYDELVANPRPDGPVGHLARVEVIDADLVVEDEGLGFTWHAADADIRVMRGDGGLAGQFDLVLDLAGDLAQLEGEVTYRPDERRLDASGTFVDVRPAFFAVVAEALKPLAAVDMPVGGAFQARFGLGSGLDQVEFDIASEPGTLRLGNLLGLDYAVAQLKVKGRATDNFRRIEINEAYADLGGPEATLAAIADADEAGGYAVKADGALRGVPVDDIEHYWPPDLAPDPRKWVVENLSRGVVREARATLSARLGPGTAPAIDRLDGEIRPEGVTVTYLRPMPPVHKVNALATFDRNVFRIAIGSGQVYGLRVPEATVVLSGLSEEDQFAAIDLRAVGPLADALKLVDSKPLGYASALGLGAVQASGDTVSDLSLKFPLLRTLTLADVAVKARSTLRQVGLPKMLLGLDLAKGDLELAVDAKGMDLKGRAMLGSIPAELAWRENFGKAPFRSRFRLSGALDEPQRRELGLDMPPFGAPFLAGSVHADVVATMQGGGDGTVEAAVDLAPAAMELPGMGWHKPPGDAGWAKVTLRMVKERIAEIPSFEVAVGDSLTAAGRVSFADGAARQVSFERFRHGRTDVAGTLGLGDVLDVQVQGASYDVAPMLAYRDEAGAEPAGKDEELPPMRVAASVERLWVGRLGGFDRVNAVIERDAKRWHSAQVGGVVSGGKTVHAELRPAEGRRRFRVVSADAGGVFRSFDVFENMVGGDLLIEGFVEDDQPGEPINGGARVSNYNVVKAPALARLLTVAAFTGIVDLLRGEGISFTTLEAPFALKDGVLTVREGRAYGPALGLTAKGRMDLRRDTVAVEGTIVPAYALNAALGNIPVIGRLFTGEKGGGVFAATYQMTGSLDEPEVTVNPLAALAPGFLRNLFNVMDPRADEMSR